MKRNLFFSQKRPRAAVVGAGLMGCWHADAIERIGGRITIIVDPDRRKADQLSKKYPKARIEANLEAVVSGGLADVVHVCTPLNTHEALARAALGAGMHVLVEKPLAENAETTSRLLSLAKSTERMVCPVHQFLFQKGVLRAQSVAQEIGPLLHVDAITCSAGAEADGKDCDEVVAEVLPHPLSLIARIVLASISKIDWRVQHPRHGEFRASGMLADASISILISMGGRPTANAVRLIGKRGTAHVDLFHGFVVAERGVVSRFRKIAHPFALAGGTLISAGTNLASRAVRGESAYPGLRELVRQFYLAIQNGGAPPIAPEETLEVARARDTLMQLMKASV